MKGFDIVVIGGGPGGYVGAIRAAQLKAKVCLIEKDALGGTCLNRGCIPTKALYYSAKTLAAVKKSSVFGVLTGEVGFDLEKAVDRKDDVVKRLVGGVEDLLKGNGVEVIYGAGSIEGAERVKVVKKDGTTEVIGTKKIIIATGSEPALIPSFNIDGVNVIASTEALNLKKVPESLLIIGGGVMGCEFATIFSKFGSSVKVVELLPAILAAEDAMVSRVIARAFKTSGVQVFTDAAVEGVEATDRGVKTRLKGGQEFLTEKVLVTIGRSFNSERLGLDNAGVTVEKGRVRVNNRMETNVDGIYAIGDVTGMMLLAHVASAGGTIASENALGKEKTMDYSVIPSGIFTDPEAASVGLKEKDAKEKGIEVKAGRFPYAASGKAIAMAEPDGFVQILSDPSTDRVLGCSIVGAHATDLIGEVALAIKAKLKVKDIIETVHAHPTLPEIVMEAAEDAHGMAVHKMGRKQG
ncbi:MAG: dihydrolipoyl dehydrogenase [Deltaproteobacteria bacterium]|nr:dihydrolipoyl dehydrogenase [Deltaproteobacteria bacterium]